MSRMKRLERRPSIDVDMVRLAFGARGHVCSALPTMLADRTLTRRVVGSAWAVASHRWHAHEALLGTLRCMVAQPRLVAEVATLDPSTSSAAQTQLSLSTLFRSSLARSRCCGRLGPRPDDLHVDRFLHRPRLCSRVSHRGGIRRPAMQRDELPIRFAGGSVPVLQEGLCRFLAGVGSDIRFDHAVDSAVTTLSFPVVRTTRMPRISRRVHPRSRRTNAPRRRAFCTQHPHHRMRHPVSEAYSGDPVCCMSSAQMRLFLLAHLHCT